MERSFLSALHLGGLANLKHSPAFGNILQYYILACKVSGKSSTTLDNYYRRTKAFLDFLQADTDCRQLSQIKNTHIRLFLASLQEKKLNPSTVNTFYRVLQTFFNWLVAEGSLKESPMRNIKPPKIPQTTPKPFSKQDIDNLLALCSGNSFTEVRNRLMILIFLDTGLRLAELANIQLGDFDATQQTIRVMGKGAKERVVRISTPTMKAILPYMHLISQMPIRQHLHFWITEQGKPLTRFGVQVTIKKLCHKANITDAKPGPHTFRHTSAIMCLRNGMGEFALQIMLGHSTLAMTRRYVSSLGAEDLIKAHKLASPVESLMAKRKNPFE